MKKAVFGGKFDPVHTRDLDIVRRAVPRFDEIVVAVYEPPATIFTIDERVQMFKEAVKDLPHVQVQPFSSLIVDFARSHGAKIIVRSMRGMTDFEYEADMSLMNRRMAPEIESLFLMSTLENLFIRSSRIREVAPLGYDVSDLVPPNVAKALRQKFGR